MSKPDRDRARLRCRAISSTWCAPIESACRPPADPRPKVSKGPVWEKRRPRTTRWTGKVYGCLPRHARRVRAAATSERDLFIIRRDPDDGWVQRATLRSMCWTRTSVAVDSSRPARHGRQIRRAKISAPASRAADRSRAARSAVFLAGRQAKFGLSDSDYAARHRGEPYDGCLSELHGLPMADSRDRAEGELSEDGPQGGSRSAS